MRLNDINIRDPFVLNENGIFYMYGTRAENFGKGTGGFDVYSSNDLINWSNGEKCFDSEKFSLNREVNWAPEVHRHCGKYYMLATFTKPNGLRGTYSLISDSPSGEFKPLGKALTPNDWECLDGTLYISRSGEPYLVFCHEHTQIIDGTICYVRLNNSLTAPIGEVRTLFSGSSPYWADKKPDGEHYITDGPFMYRTKGDELLLIWSTFVNHKYCQCVARSSNGEIDGTFEHLPLLIDDDGGHGMIFEAFGELFLSLHTPNKSGFEHPKFIKLTDNKSFIAIKE